MSRTVTISMAITVLSLGGCGAVSSAVGTTFQIAHGLGSLSVAGTKHSIGIAQAGVSVAQSGVELAGGAVRLMDQSHEAGHRARMRNLAYERAVDASANR